MQSIKPEFDQNLTNLKETKKPVIIVAVNTRPSKTLVILAQINVKLIILCTKILILSLSHTRECSSNKNVIPQK